MQCNYIINSQRQMVMTTLVGVTTAAEALAHQEALASDPEFRPEFYQLLDASETTKLDLSSSEMRGLAKKNFFAPSARRAWLVRGTLLYGVGRMLVTFRELAGAKEQMQIFQDRKEARTWLGLAPE